MSIPAKNPPAVKATALPDGSFLATIQTMRKGATLVDLEQALRELVQLVRRVRKPGVMQWKLKVSPNSKGNVEILAIDDEVIIKPPKTEGGVSIYFANDDGALMRNDPNQMEIRGIVEVPAEPVQPIRQVGT